MDEKKAKVPIIVLSALLAVAVGVIVFLAVGNQKKLDPAADDVLFRALDPDREKRFRSIAQFADEMAPLLGYPDVGYADIRGMMAADAAAAESLMARELPPVAVAPAILGAAAVNGSAEDLEPEGGQTGIRGLFAKLKNARAERRQNAQLEREMRQREANEARDDASADS